MKMANISVILAKLLACFLLIVVPLGCDGTISRSIDGDQDNPDAGDVDAGDASDADAGGDGS